MWDRDLVKASMMEPILTVKLLASMFRMWRLKRELCRLDPRARQFFRMRDNMRKRGVL